MLAGEFGEERVDSWEVAWMERGGEVIGGFVGVGIRTVPSRRAFRYFA